MTVVDSIFSISGQTCFVPFTDSLSHDVTDSMQPEVDKIKAELAAQFEAEKERIVAEYEQKLNAMQVKSANIRIFQVLKCFRNL